METSTIRRSSYDRMIAGVAGGLAAYLKVDVNIVRLALVILGLINGIGAFIYLLMWLLIPSDRSITPGPREQVQENVEEMRDTAEDFIQRLRSMFNANLN